MQQVARSIRQKHKRDRLRHKIQSITPHQYSNSVRYYNDPVIPHEVLARQFQHMNRYAYNKKEEISSRQIYPISEALIYQPLRYNQLQAEYQRSKSLHEGNEFLSNYSEKEHSKRKEEYFSRIKVIELAKKEEEEARMKEVKETYQIRERKMRRSTVLPPIKSKIARLRFRIAGIAVYFTCLVRLRLKRTIKYRIKMCDKQHKNYLRAATESIQKFYYNKIEKQITQYILLLQKKIKYPNYKTDSDIIAILISLFNKLNTLPVPTSILQALSLISCSYSSFPIPFLYTEELKRLPFLRDQECTGALSQEESLMVTACFIVVKLFCINLLYRPWLVQDLFRRHQQRHIDLRSKYRELKRTINHMGSLPYFIVIDSFFLDCPVVHSQSEIDQLAKDRIIDTIPFMQVTPKDASEDSPFIIDSSEEEEGQEEGAGETVSGRTEKDTRVEKELVDGVNLIAGQNRGFYGKMRETHGREMNNLQFLINDWVTKVTLSVLDLSAQERCERVRKYIR